MGQSKSLDPQSGIRFLPFNPGENVLKNKHRRAKAEFPDWNQPASSPACRPPLQGVFKTRNGEDEFLLQASGGGPFYFHSLRAEPQLRFEWDIVPQQGSPARLLWPGRRIQVTPSMAPVWKRYVAPAMKATPGEFVSCPDKRLALKGNQKEANQLGTPVGSPSLKAFFGRL